MIRTTVGLATYVSVLCPYRNPAFTDKGPEERDEYQIELTFEPPESEDGSEALALGEFVEEVQAYHDIEISGERLAQSLAAWATNRLGLGVNVEVQTRDLYPPPLRVVVQASPGVQID